MNSAARSRPSWARGRLRHVMTRDRIGLSISDYPVIDCDSSSQCYGKKLDVYHP
jgi:hypothetical protein